MNHLTLIPYVIQDNIYLHIIGKGWIVTKWHNVVSIVVHNTEVFPDSSLFSSFCVYVHLYLSCLILKLV